MATIPFNDLGQWTAGQTAPTWEFPLQRDTRIFDLTGVSAGSLVLVVYNSLKARTGTGGGTFAINANKPAVVTYTQNPSASDIATAGTYYFRIEVPFSYGTDYSDYIKIVVNA